MDQWFDPDPAVARDLVREADGRQRHAAAVRVRTTPFHPARRRTDEQSL
ncbi:hypothetical protein [Georgenia sunbinii]